MSLRCRSLECTSIGSHITLSFWVLSCWWGESEEEALKLIDSGAVASVVERGPGV
jgi:hypothetical protein